MNKLHRKTINSNIWKILKEVAGTPELNNFYLVGGTALALQIGHRISDDLDFFSQDEFKSNILKKFDQKHEVISLHDNSIELSVGGTKVMFFYFGFPLQMMVETVNGVRLASPTDIGLMKLLALQGRSTRKDIIDLYFIHKEIIPLDKLLEIFENAYPSTSFNSYKSLQNLLDFVEIEKQPMPKLIKRFSWETAKKLIISSITRHLRQLL